METRKKFSMYASQVDPCNFYFFFQLIFTQNATEDICIKDSLATKFRRNSTPVVPITELDLIKEIENAC